MNTNTRQGGNRQGGKSNTRHKGTKATRHKVNTEGQLNN